MTIGALETMLADIQDGEVDVEQRIIDLLLRDDVFDEAQSGLDQLRSGMEQLQREMAGSMDHFRAAALLTAEVLDDQGQ
jgi:hypothetical protein